jgi:FMN reductase
MAGEAGARSPLIVGMGGSGRPGSATERALALAMRGAEEGGAYVRVFGGAFLARLPMFQPQEANGDMRTVELLSAIADADGLIIASPSYHAGVSGMVKNALDHLEALRDNSRPYLDGRAVGCIVTSAGYQAGDATLSALRSIVHALRGWPTPLGVAVGTAPGGDGQHADPVSGYAVKLRTVGSQVTGFAQVFGTASSAPARAGVSW